MDSVVEVEFKELCRICANPKAQNQIRMISIFDEDGMKIELLDKIKRYLPIGVSKDDGFPELVCIPCTSKLNLCHQLNQTCTEANARLHALKQQLDIETSKLNFHSPEPENNDVQTTRDDSSDSDTNTTEHKSNPKVTKSESKDKEASTSNSNQNQTVFTPGDSQVALILAEKDGQTDVMPKLNIVLVNIPKEDPESVTERVENALKVYRESDSDSEAANNELLDKNLDDNQLRQVIAEAELMQMQAAESFLRTLEENLDEPVNAKPEETIKVVPIEKLKQTERYLYDPPPKIKIKTEENVLSKSTSSSEVRRSQRRRIKNKFYDSDSDANINSNIYECKLCKKVFINPSGLRVHNAKNSHKLQVERMTCLTCNAKFETIENAENHECNLDLKFSCDFCDQIFTNAQDADLHRLQHSNGPFTCAICNDQFNNLSILQDHIMQHTRGNRPYQCNYCGKMLKSKLGLQGHQLRHTTARTYLCYICQVPFSEKEEMLSHRLTHSQEEKDLVQSKKNKVLPVKFFPCTLCSKVLSSKAGLIIHLRMHKGEKPFSCDECGRQFRQAIKLRYHQRLHAGNLPYVCSLCEKRFNTQRQLDTHMRVHTNERPYICEVCGVRFRSNGVLGRHRNTHSEEPLFSCSFCGKRFRTRHATTVHERTHTGEKRFMCDICGRSFAQKTTLDKHRLRHEKQRVECLECNTTFASRKGLRRHYERKHTPVLVESIQMLDGTTRHEYVSVPMDDLVVEVVV